MRYSQRLALVVLDQRIGADVLEDLPELLRIVGLQLDHPPDVDVADALEAERRQRPLDRLALRVEDALLGADQHSCLQKLSPVIRSYASMYFARVCSTTSAGRSGAGGFLSQPCSVAQSRTYCLSKDGGVTPGSQDAAGQKREESGVSTSSPSTTSAPAS